MRNVVITGAARTPMGGFQGVFTDVAAPTLGGAAIKAAMDGAGITTVDEILMGCVLPAGIGQAPARQAGFLAGLDETVPATTLNKMCGSGMKAAMMAYDQIALGGAQSMIAGGMESMTNAPYLMPKMRAGARIGHQTVQDSMFLDGLEDAYDKGRLMGTFAEDCAEKYQFTREAQDEYALGSLSNALAAQESGAFVAYAVGGPLVLLLIAIEAILSAVRQKHYYSTSDTLCTLGLLAGNIVIYNDMPTERHNHHKPKRQSPGKQNKYRGKPGSPKIFQTRNVKENGLGVGRAIFSLQPKSVFWLATGPATHFRGADRRARSYLSVGQNPVPLDAGRWR